MYRNTKIIKTSDAGPVEDHIWKYELMFPDFIATVSVDNPKGWDVWDYWERERIASMQENLKKGDFLFDVGSESGALSALYCKYMVGEGNIVLFEPSPKYWSLIREIWRENNLGEPLGCFQGFVGRISKKGKKVGIEWPECSNDPVIDGGMPYAYMNNPVDEAKIPTVSLDDWSKIHEIVPDAITIDVEGAELEVIRGASNLLVNNDLKVWVSVHPDLMLKNFGVTEGGLFAWMKRLGYVGELLAVDHEAHWFFKKKEKKS